MGAPDGAKVGECIDLQIKPPQAPAFMTTKAKMECQGNKLTAVFWFRGQGSATTCETIDDGSQVVGGNLTHDKASAMNFNSGKCSSPVSVLENRTEYYKSDTAMNLEFNCDP